MTYGLPNTNATINIEIGYGFFDKTDFGSTQPVGASSSLGADILSGSGSYSAIRAALAAIPNPSASLSALHAVSNRKYALTGAK